MNKKETVKIELLSPNHVIELKDKGFIDMYEFLFMLQVYSNMVQSVNEHNRNPETLYELHWVVRDIKTDNIGGMIGLSEINHKDKRAALRTADVQRSKIITKACTFIENYCIDNLKLNSVYGHADRDATIAFWKKFGYTTKTASKDVKGAFLFEKIFGGKQYS